MVKKYSKAFNLKWNSDWDSHEDLRLLYSAYIHALQKRGLVVEYLVQEFDTKDVLHLHGKVKIPFGFKYLEMPMPGFSQKIKEITNELGWLAYCRGDKGPDKINNKLWDGLVPFAQGYYQDFTPSKPNAEMREVVYNYQTRYAWKQYQKTIQGLDL